MRLPKSTTRCPRLATLRSSLLSIQPPRTTSRPDQFLWCEHSHFSTKKTWDTIRVRKEIQPWARMIWAKSSIPKHSFLFWVTTLNRLPLRTRIRQWGMDINDTCCLCSNSPEDRDHLFLHCDFVQPIWSWLSFKMRGAHYFSTWDTLLEWLDASSTRKQRIVSIICTQSIIYMIWKERNRRIHKGTSTTAACLISEIDKTVRAILLATRSRRHHNDLLSFWFIR